MSDKRNQANPRRVFQTWTHALYVATSYGIQTGRKWQVYRAGPVWRIRRTERPFVRDSSFGASARRVEAWDRARAATGRPPWKPTPPPEPTPGSITFVAVGPIMRVDP